MKTLLQHIVNDLNGQHENMQSAARRYLKDLLATQPQQRIELSEPGYIVAMLSENWEEVPIAYLALDKNGTIRLGRQDDALQDTYPEYDHYISIDWRKMLNTVFDTLGEESLPGTPCPEIMIVRRTHPLSYNDTFDSYSYAYFHEVNVLVNGTLLLDKWASCIEYIRHGLFLVRYDGRTKLIDTRGNDIIPYPCKSISLYDSGMTLDNRKTFKKENLMLKIVRDDNKMNYVRLDGSTVLPEWYDEISEPHGPYLGKFLKVSENGLYNFADIKTGEKVYPEDFESVNADIKRVSAARKVWGNNLIAVVKHKGRWKVLLVDGKLL